MSGTMIFVEDHLFQKHCADLLDDEDLIDLFEWLATRPETGKLIRGGGGLRKLRWSGSGRGKRGGARVIYFWWLSDDRILLLDIYAKKDKDDLSAKELESLKRRIVK
jgi:hypothetical protein